MSFAEVPRMIAHKDLFESSPLQSSCSIEELGQELQGWYSSFELYDDFPSDYIFESDISTSDYNHSDHSDSDESGESEDSDEDLVVDTEREGLWKRTHQHFHKNPPSLQNPPSQQYGSLFHSSPSHTAARKRWFASLAEIVDTHNNEALDSFANSSTLSSEPRFIVHYSCLPSSPTKHQAISPSPLRRELRLFKRRPITNPSSSNVQSSEPKLVAYYSPLSMIPINHQAASPRPLCQELCVFDPPLTVEEDEIDPFEEGWV